MARRREDDDDDYREDDREDRGRRRSRRPDPPPPGDGGGTAVKIILIIGGVFLGIALVCGGLAFYVFYNIKKAADNTIDSVSAAIEKEQKVQKEKQAERSKAKQVADNFLADVKAGLIDAAYKATTSGYQNRINKEQFSEIVKSSKGDLGKILSLSDRGFGNLDPPYIFESQSFVAQNKFVKVEVSVAKEGADYKVDRFVVGQ